ncbi:MAG: hypothetical protein IAE93_12850 [Ignavibacteria bacterium]|nr:hypothetical protein [Ignavibacteria bacterium]
MSIRLADILTLPITTTIRREAERVTRLKGNYIHDTFEIRTLPERIRRSYEGDMAKLAIIGWLEDNGKEVLDWDTARNGDWTTSNKPYDILVSDKNIEIRSSKEIGKSLGFILRNRNIIQPTYANILDVTIQAYWNDEEYENVHVFAWNNRDDFLNAPVRNIRGQTFHMMPFTANEAQPMNDLLNYL